MVRWNYGKRQEKKLKEFCATLHIFARKDKCGTHNLQTKPRYCSKFQNCKQTKGQQQTRGIKYIRGHGQRATRKHLIPHPSNIAHQTRPLLHLQIFSSKLCFYEISKFIAVNCARWIVKDNLNCSTDRQSPTCLKIVVSRPTCTAAFHLSSHLEVEVKVRLPHQTHHEQQR